MKLVNEAKRMQQLAGILKEDGEPGLDDDWGPFEQVFKQELKKRLKFDTDNYRLSTDLNGRKTIVDKEKMSIDEIANHYLNGCKNIFDSYEEMKEFWEDYEGDEIRRPAALVKKVLHTSKDALIDDNSSFGKHVAFLMIDDGYTMDVYRQVSDMGSQALATTSLSEKIK